MFVTQPRLLLNPAILKRGVHTEAVNLCLEKNSGIIATEDYRGVQAITGYRWLADRELCLVVKLDQKEAFSPVRALGRNIAFLGGFTLIAATIAAYWLASTITHPIMTLRNGAIRIGRGDLDYRIEVTAKDEIGILGKSFNEMAANLQTSLGETAHSQQMLLGLSQAGQAVQRAKSSLEIFKVVGEEVVKLGYHAFIFLLTEDGSHLQLVHHTFDLKLMRAVEKIAGLTAIGFSFRFQKAASTNQSLSGVNSLL